MYEIVVRALHHSFGILVATVYMREKVPYPGMDNRLALVQVRVLNNSLLASSVFHLHYTVVK